MASNSLFDDIPECPLCLEPLGLDDINFYPCACRYQICRFCWHRIRTDENGLCPHCREVYPENPTEYTPPTTEQLAKNKSEKKQKEICKRQKVMESREKLASVRLADPEILKRNEYFGKYGKIYKVVINNHTIYNGAQGPSVSAYVTYCRNEDASKAIAVVNNAFIDGRSLKASFGTTKYCTSFLKGTLCTKPDCMYLHGLGEDEASFTKEDMQLGKHQVFENATLASLLPAAGSVKDHAPSAVSGSVMAEGGVKIKHTVIPRNKESLQPDLAESALPATAHWASNQKPQGGDSVMSDQPPSNPKQSDSGATSKQTKNLGSKAHTHSSLRAASSELSSSSHSRHTGPSKITQRDNTSTTQKHDGGDESTVMLKSNSRPGSVSPNTQKSGHSRTLEPQKRSLGGPSRAEQDRDSIRTNHSQGSSITKSMTPNMSPRSTLSTSSSSGSLRQDTDDAAGVGVSVVEVELNVEKADENDGEGGRGVEVPGGSRGVVLEEEDSESVGYSIGSQLSSGEDSQTNAVTEQFEGVRLSRSEGQGVDSQKQAHAFHSKSDARNTREGVAIPVAPSTSALPPVVMSSVEGSSPPISSPPGLSKTRIQPLPLSAQSERICRQLDLASKPLPLQSEHSTINHHLLPESSRTQQPSGLISRGVGRSNKQIGLIGAGRGRGRGTYLVTNPSGSNNVISSLASAGSGHFGALGVNWSLPVAVAHNISPTPFHPNPSSTTQATPSLQPHDPNPPPQLPGSLVKFPRQSPLLPTPSLQSSQSHKIVDDGDELGFDPWDISQQGLADLLETEAEQKQHKPHPLETSHPANKKRTPNGLTPFMSDHKASLYNSWHHVSSLASASSLTSSSSTTCSTADVSSVAAGGSVDDSGSFPSSGGDSLRDEFRALFPNVNISFGEALSKSKSEMSSSPLVQALDASTPSSASYPTHLATALNYSYHTPHHARSSIQGHTHHLPAGKFPSSESAAPSTGMPNLFLGQSQPGFPASCFRVKGHSSGIVTSTTTTMASTSTVASASDSTNSYSSCLGPDWPDLGITLGHSSKMQSKLVPVITGTATGEGPGPGESDAVGGSATWKVSSSGNDGNKASVTVSSSSSTSVVPPPPPGFSKTHVAVDGNSLLSGGGATTLSAAVGTGTGNQTATTSNSHPMLLANSKGQVFPSHLLQSWSNLRKFANLTPAQQQQLARTTSQLTYQQQQQQQQLLAQQYLFQQALLRNPVLQAQSLRMVQQFQQAALLQQQALKAGLTAGNVNSTTSRINPTSITTAQGPKLLSNDSPVSVTSATAGTRSSSGTKVAISNPPKHSKVLHQNVATSGLKEQSHPSGGGGGRSSGQSGSRGFSSGHSRNSCQMTSSSGQSNSSVGLNSKGSEQSHSSTPRNSKSKARSVSGSVHHSSNPSGVEKRPRQKSSK